MKAGQNIAQTQWLSIRNIEANTGQIEGLPENPRIIKDGKFDRLCKSIEENPEMLTLRPLLVFPYGKKYVVIGGNMRLAAMKKLGYKDAPCVIIPESTPIENLRAYTIKDNAPFGEWDWDLLANEWNEKELLDFGLDIWQPENEAEEENAVPDKDEKDGERLTFRLSKEQSDFVKECLKAITIDESETHGNTDEDGNKLYILAQEWAGLKTERESV